MDRKPVLDRKVGERARDAMSRRALYVCGACLFRNTSANMSHHGFVRGLVENGFDVDVLMPSESFGPLDPGLPRIAGVRYVLHSGASVRDAIVQGVRRGFDGAGPSAVGGLPPPGASGGGTRSIRARLRGIAASANAAMTRRDPHRASRPWMRRACRFSSSDAYEVVLSNSSPASSHRVAASLLASGRIATRRWMQVWEDPWYHDVYRKGAAPRVLEEEAALLRIADEILYVSPLTLQYQRRHFPEASGRMRLVALPAFPPAPEALRSRGTEPPVFGYFGDYYSHTRDLAPFLEAVRAVGARAEICGDTDLRLASTERIRVRGRVTLPVLAGIESATDVLVAVCNRRGGQLPGKLYHYAATEKPILLVLDGSMEERRAIRSHFEPLGRFEFSDNEAAALERALGRFHDGRSPRFVRPEPSFEARAVVSQLLAGAG